MAKVRMAKDHAARRSRKRIVGIVLGVVVALVVGAVAFAGNFLFEFALDPHASYSMKSLSDAGGADTGTTDAPKLDAAYAEEAAAWFDQAKESVSLVADDGTELLGWEFPAEAPAAGTDAPAAPAAGTDAPDASPAAPYADGHTYAVVCHGYTNQPSGMAKYAYRFHELGMTVLAPAARAHERNENTGFIQMGWRDSADLMGWLAQIVEADPQARIVLFGVSMGGAEVMMASGNDELPENVVAIIEDCGYTSVWDEFSLQLSEVFGLPSFPLLNAADAVCQLRAGYSFEEASAEQSLMAATVPMLFIHGSADTFVPFSMLDEVYDACGSSVKEKLVVEGAGHAESASTDPELYWSSVEGFLARVL